MASLSRTPGASTMLNRGAPASTPLAKVTQYWEMMQPKTQSQKKYRVGGVDVDAAVDAAVTEFSEGGALEALVDDVMTRADADGNGTIDPKELKHYFFLQRRPRKAGGKTVAGKLPAMCIVTY